MDTRWIIFATLGMMASAPSMAAAEDTAEAAPLPLTFAAGQFASFLQSVQHPSTGLPASFSRSVNAALKNVSFTYDTAVSAIVLSHAGASSAAKKALATYLRMPLPSSGGFEFNTAYSTVDRSPTLEYQVHGGPVFWMAIALMRYGQVSGEGAFREKGVSILEWARTHLPHKDGGVAMSHRDFWASIMSVENNWVYYAALRVAAEALPQGQVREALAEERRALYRWLWVHHTFRGPGDEIGALDVYTHALLVGPEAHLEDGFLAAPELAAWAKHHIEALEARFQIPGRALYDYTDAAESARIGRERLAWLEGTEQVSVAYKTWARWFERQGDRAFAKALRIRAAVSHAQVMEYRLPVAKAVALPNTASALPARTFLDGWEARPRSEPALNGTNWAYLSDVEYNPFTTPLPSSAQ